MMTKLEKARRNLHQIIESGNREEILQASQQLDELILRQMIQQQEQKNIPQCDTEPKQIIWQTATSAWRHPDTIVHN